MINNTVYPDDFEIKDTFTTESVSSVSNFDILLEKDAHGNLTTKLYD